MGERPMPLMLRICSDGLSIEALPRRKLHLNLVELREEFESSGKYDVMLHTPHFMVIRHSSGVEVTLRRDGRMIIRKARTEDHAREMALGVLNLAMNTSRAI